MVDQQRTTMELLYFKVLSVCTVDISPFFPLAIVRRDH